MFTNGEKYVVSVYRETCSRSNTDDVYRLQKDTKYNRETLQRFVSTFWSCSKHKSVSTGSLGRTDRLQALEQAMEVIQLKNTCTRRFISGLFIRASERFDLKVGSIIQYICKLAD